MFSAVPLVVNISARPSRSRTSNKRKNRSTSSRLGADDRPGNTRLVYDLKKVCLLPHTDQNDCLNWCEGKGNYRPEADKIDSDVTSLFKLQERT